MNPRAHPSQGKPSTPSWLEVDLGRLADNVAGVLAITRGDDRANGTVAGSVVCGVVKKNAYGLGACQVTRRLQQAGAGMAAVYSPDEAEELVAGGIALGEAFPALLLCPLYEFTRTAALYRAASSGGLHLTLHTAEQARKLDDAFRRLGLKMPVHLFVDTGMTREGMSPDEAAELWPELLKMHGLRVAGLMTHFATADDDYDFACEQSDTYDDVLSRLEDAAPLPRDLLLHVGNSFATLRDRRFHRHVVRTGVGLYGYAQAMLPPGPIIAELPAPPEDGVSDGEADTIDTPELLPVMKWCSRITHVRTVEPGAKVGYGATATLKRKSVLGLVSVGYGDGYPMALSNKANVRVALPGSPDSPGSASGAESSAAPRIATCKLVGRVNMDQLIIDLTTAVQKTKLDPDAVRGCEVEVYSNDPAAPNAVPKLAKTCKTHAYELMCRINPRVPRVYVG